MWRKVLELSAAGLVAFALWGDYLARGAEPVAPSDECVSMATVLQVVGEQPALDLKGDALVAFNSNYRKIIEAEPPPVDEIIVFGKLEDDEAQLLFLTFKDGCVAQSALVSAKDFMKVYRGVQA